MKVIAGNLDGSELCIGDLPARLILTRIDLGANLKSFARCGCGYQVDDDLVAYQWLAAPVQGDEREHAMLDLVPLGSTWWKVAHPDGQI